MKNISQTNIQIPSVINNIFREVDISPSNLLSQYVLNIVYSKINKYEAEILSFENKHNSTYKEFKGKIEKMKNEECFEWEDDLMDWEFAFQNLNYWKNKVKDIKENDKYY